MPPDAPASPPGDLPTPAPAPAPRSVASASVRPPPASVPPPSSSHPASFPPPPEVKGDAWQLGRREEDAPLPAHEIMRAQEVLRTRVFFVLVLALSVIVLLLLPVLGGDPGAKRAAYMALGLSAAASAWFVSALRDEDRYTTDRVLFVGLLALAGALACVAYFGVFSLACAILPIGLFFFGSVGDGRASILAYVGTAIGYFALVAAQMRGALPDTGLVAAGMIPREKVVLAGLVEVLILLTFLNARSFRSTSLVALVRHDRLVRGLAQRDALLKEARQDLARALDVAGVGRFSDTTVGSYQLGNVIGRGSMGEVYEAFHLQTRKEAAVKLLHPHTMRDRTMLKRFVREAKMAASLDTPNVVRVLEVGGFDREGEIPYIAMERLRGEDLSDRLRRDGHLSLDDVTAMLVQVGRGLSAARAAGIVHRDLKPRNIFLAEPLDAKGSAAPGPRTWKILDFGVSKLAGQEATQTFDRIVGTPEYMAPEQAAGAEVTHRTDLFSLAVIAYRAITGRPAFTGDHIVEILYRVASTMPPKASEVVSVSPEVDAVLAVAMAKTPADRFENAEEFAAALSAAGEGKIDEALARRAERVLEKHPWDGSPGASSVSRMTAAEEA